MKTKIRELRKARKLSQEELADAVGTTRQTITSIEVGKYTAGKVDVLICIGTLAKYIYEGAMNHKEENMFLLYLREKEELYSHLEHIIMPQDTILLKASHGMGFSEIVSWFEKNYS